MANNMMGPPAPQAMPQQMPQQQQDPMMNMLLQALQPRQRPDPTNYGREQADVDAILADVDRLDRRDEKSRGILGYFGRKSRGKKRDELMGQYKSELAQALAEKNAYLNDQEAYSRGNSMQDNMMMEYVKNQFKEPGDLARYMKSSPEERELIMQYYAGKRAPGVTVNTGEKETSFQKAMGSKGAELYSSMQTAVQNIPKMNVHLDAMENVLKAFDTGRIEDVQAQMGAWLGTDAGNARDVFNSQLTPMKLMLGEQVKGSMQVAEWEMLEKALPNFGIDKKATEVVIGLIRKGQRRQLENYQSATEYANQHGGLTGWVPPNIMNSTTMKAQDMSDEDLMKALEGDTNDD